MMFLIFITWCLLGVLFLPSSVLAEKTLVISSAPNKPLSTFYEKVLKEALLRIGYKLEIVHLLAERALISANRGIIDGDIARILGLKEIYPNLIPIREFIFEVKFVLLTKTARFTVDGWHSLRPYTVAFITGWKIFEKNIQDVKQIFFVKNKNQLFYLLQKGRIDVIAYNRVSGLGFLRNNKISGIHILHPPLSVQKLFVYLHRKHKIIIPLIENSLRNLKIDGTYDRIFKEILNIDK